MKRIYRYTPLFLVLALFSGCNYTEPEMLSFISEKEVVKNMNEITYLINNVYTYLPGGFDAIGNSSVAAACDEAEEVDDDEDVQDFNTGNWGLFYNPEGDVWKNNYTGIRRANAFIALLKKVDWSYLKAGTPDEYVRRVALTTQHKYEAYYLRAFYYFELIKRYGGVPILARGYDPNDELDSLVNLPRSNFSDCVDFIVNDCDSAAKYLPVDYSSATSYYGRATKGAALALKARTLLYAASDLFNQTGNTNAIFGYTDGNRKEKWIRTAKACKAVMDMTNYSFHSSYSDLFVLKSGVSKEVIFERRLTSGNSFEKLNYPIGFYTGQTHTCPTQNLVDAYSMANGKEITDPTSGYDPNNPYLNRDPRLLKTIVVNKSTFGKNNTIVEAWEGGLQGLPRESASKTGYYLRKYLNESLDLSLSSGTSTHQWIYFRLAEVYLNYAEAMVSAFGSPTAVSQADGLTLSAISAINSVRTRAAVKMPAVDNSVSTADFIRILRRERQVELAFEDHRYWDVRRWMIADQAIGGTIQGLRITKDATTGVFTYTKKDVETRVWDSKMYLYPIFSSEMNKSKVLVQNPGW